MSDGKEVHPITQWYWPDEMVVSVAFAGNAYRLIGSSDGLQMSARDRAVVCALLRSALAEVEAIP